MTDFPLIERIALALQARAALFEPRHETAFRLFNGFLEGAPDLAIDLYASTLLVHDYADDPALGAQQSAAAIQFLREQLPWLSCGLVKQRSAASPEERRGLVVFGGEPARKIRENGVTYALDLQMNRDASLYLDTRLLRAWIKSQAAGLRVLNLFAYTGSLGAAALAGGAARVVQSDLNRAFLNLAKTTYTLNGFPIHKPDFIAGDFWLEVNALKRRAELFDLVLLDPPFFAATERGRVDLDKDSRRVINKVRPLVADGGRLVTINNALFASGQEYMAMLQDLCADGYLSVEETIPVPPDFCGYAQTICGTPPADPAPFNHSTKIAVLRVRRKAAA